MYNYVGVIRTLNDKCQRFMTYLLVHDILIQIIYNIVIGTIREINKAFLLDFLIVKFVQCPGHIKNNSCAKREAQNKCIFF